jgi:copper chaperone CopZ
MYIDECLRRIAARLCLLEISTNPSDEQHVNRIEGLGGAPIDETVVNGAVQQQQKGCSASSRDTCSATACDVGNRAVTACGTSANDPRQTGEERKAPFSPTSVAKSGCKSSCCDEAPTTQLGVAKAKDSSACCKSPTVHSVASRDCIDECCEFVRDTVTTDSSSACSSHLRAAFEKFEALIRQSICICRTVIEQVGFCCCALSSDGSILASPLCTGHTGSPAGTVSSKMLPPVHVAAKTGRDTCCTDPKPKSCGGSRAAPDNTCDRLAVCSTEEKPGTSNDIESCSDGCCATAIQNSGKCGNEESKPQVTGTSVSHHKDVDVENNAAREHVVLSVSGMTCTGCSTKMQNVLDVIPGLYKPQVTFVSGTAAFELDHVVTKLDELLPLIERRTGFKCSQIVEGYEHLDLQMTPQMAEELGNSGVEGIVSVLKTKRNDYRVA